MFSIPRQDLSLCLVWQGVCARRVKAWLGMRGPAGPDGDRNVGDNNFPQCLNFLDINIFELNETWRTYPFAISLGAVML